MIKEHISISIQLKIVWYFIYYKVKYIQVKTNHKKEITNTLLINKIKLDIY